jgi:hypothetical protein
MGTPPVLQLSQHSVECLMPPPWKMNIRIVRCNMDPISTYRYVGRQLHLDSLDTAVPLSTFLAPRIIPHEPLTILHKSTKEQACYISKRVRIKVTQAERNMNERRERITTHLRKPRIKERRLRHDFRQAKYSRFIATHTSSGKTTGKNKTSRSDGMGETARDIRDIGF